MKKNVTIANVSRIAGVSTSTVSHVINGTRHVNADTKNKVLKAIEQTGYTQNFVAKSLKKSKTKTIGLIISDFSNPFFIDVISGIEYEAYRNGYTVILSDSHDDAQRELEILQNFFARRIDGLILSPTTFSENKTVPFLRKIDLPTVLIDRFLDIDCDWVGIENINSTKSLVNHLIKLGHQKIAIVAGLRGINTTEERILGYKTALMEANLQYDDSYIIYGGSRSKPAEENVMDFFHNAASQPTALVVANNLMVLGTMRALKKLDLHVPEDIALVSFDDFEWSDLFHPRLTTISQPCFEIGVKAAELAIKRIENVLTQPQRICLEPTLIIRESCGSNLKGE